MSQIRATYSEQPSWPAKDNHPDAERFEIQHQGQTWWADCIGGAPSQAEVDEYFERAK